MGHGFRIYFPRGIMELAGNEWLRGLDKNLGKGGFRRNPARFNWPSACWGSSDCPAA